MQSIILFTVYIYWFQPGRIFPETRPRTVHTLWTVLPLDASGSRVSLLGQLLLLLLLLLRLEEKEGLAVGKPVVDVL